MYAPAGMAAAPMAAPQQPMIMHSADSSGGKTNMALVAILLALLAFAAAYLLFGTGSNSIVPGKGPTWNELHRWENLAKKEGELRGRDIGWLAGRKQGTTEMAYMAKYERLRGQAQSFNEGWKQGAATGKMMGSAKAQAAMWNMRGRYGWSGYGRGYGYGYGRGYGYGYGRGYGYGGYGYGGRTGNAVAQAQNLANATGQAVDVVVY